MIMNIIKFHMVAVVMINFFATSNNTAAKITIILSGILFGLLLIYGIKRYMHTPVAASKPTTS